jgi:hypothetical protein
VVLREEGLEFKAGMPDAAKKALGLDDPRDQAALGRIVAGALGLRGDPDLEPLRLAQAAQEFAQHATPRTAWSRFMAKLGLACGREAYGEEWLEGRHALILSRDLHGSEPPRFAQRGHYPPVEPIWPYQPPGHRLWIEPHDGSAVLMIVLFGQVLGAVPVNDLPAKGDPSAWSLDPRDQTVHRSTFPAIWLGSAMARLNREGREVVAFADSEARSSLSPMAALVQLICRAHFGRNRLRMQWNSCEA